MSANNSPMKKTGDAYFFIGDIPVFGDCILAPMDGVTDMPFRTLARKMGSAFCVTEFINAMDVVNGYPYLEERISYHEMERPIGFQVFDNETDRLLKASQILCKYKPDFIDINIGCSVRKVSRRGAGAGLLLDPPKIASMISSLSKSLDIPVTAKIRLGWDPDHLNYKIISKIIEDEGGKLITVHGRTKDQGFTGPVDMDAIARIKQIVKIPVVANGDIKSVQDIDYVKKYTACDAVMIGRAAIGNPWIFGKRNRISISNNELLSVIKEHLSQMVQFYGEARGVMLFRKHLKRYLKPVDMPSDTWNKFLTEENYPSLLTMVGTLLL